MKGMKVRSIIGLLLLYIAVFMDWQWVWGILFLIWVIPDLVTGKTYFMEAIEKKSNPVLYWAIVLSWIWMSAYMLASATFPQLIGQAVQPVWKSQAVGSYIERNSPPVFAAGESDNHEHFSDAKASAGSKDSDADAGRLAQTRNQAVKPIPNSAKLEYKVWDQPQKQYFVGLSATFNAQDPELQKHTEELWQYFYENDLSQVISDIEDERVYFVYSPVDKQQTYTATLGFRTKSIDKVYEGLTGIEVPSGQYGVFEHKGKGYEQFLSQRWAEIYESDLPIDQGYSMEVYSLDANYNVSNTEIRVPIQ